MNMDEKLTRFQFYSEMRKTIQNIGKNINKQEIRVTPEKVMDISSCYKSKQQYCIDYFFLFKELLGIEFSN